MLRFKKMRDTILTLTVNPALDHAVTVDRLVFEDRAYILATNDGAGGRGLNAARVLTSFGSKVVAIIPSGGEGGKTLEDALKRDGFKTDLVKIKNNIRTNLTISDRQGLTVKLNERGPSLSSSEVERLEKKVEQHLSSASWLMLCGSLPPGVPSDFYAKLAVKAEKKGVQTLLDTDEDALLHGLEGRPTVVTPNQSEAERLLNRVLITRAQVIEGAKQIQSMGPHSVLLSLGSRGVVAVTESSIFEATPPRIQAVCPIGAGDAMGAAFVWARSQGKAFEEAVRWGVAAGTASAKLPGVNLPSFEQTQEIFPQVEVIQIHS